MATVIWEHAVAWASTIGDDVFVWQWCGNLLWLALVEDAGLAQTMNFYEVGVEPIAPQQWHHTLTVDAESDGWDRLPHLHLKFPNPKYALRSPAIRFGLCVALGNENTPLPPPTLIAA